MSILQATALIVERVEKYPLLEQRITDLLISNNQFEERARKAERECKLLREALEPFAAMVPAAIGNDTPDTWMIVLTSDGEPIAQLPVNSFRDAAGALGKWPV